MPTIPYIKRKLIPALTVGMDAETIANGAPITSSTFSVEGYNQLSVMCYLTHVAATAVTMYLETTTDGTRWCRYQASALAGGTETITNHIVSKAVAGSVNWGHNFPGIFGDRARLVFAGTDGTTDTLTAEVVLGVTL
jgi:hypothetical protein